MNVKVLGDGGSGLYSWVCSGITWAADNGANVISLSLAGTMDSAALQSAVDYAWSKGAVVLAAAGNSANSTPNYPAAYANAMAVAATTDMDKLASFSNYGDWVDIAAPGITHLLDDPRRLRLHERHVDGNPARQRAGRPALRGRLRHERQRAAERRGALADPGQRRRHPAHRDRQRPHQRLPGGHRRRRASAAASGTAREHLSADHFGHPDRRPDAPGVDRHLDEQPDELRPPVAAL